MDRADHPEPGPSSPAQAGLEQWLRARGIRPGPFYTVIQVAVVIAAIILAVLLFS